MKVELVTYTPKRTPKHTPNTEKVLVGSLRHRLASGHESVSEHASFTFAIEGVSRELTHQLVRYGIASYSQHSQRHVKTDGFDYVIPDSIRNHEKTWDEDGKTDVEKWYRNAMEGLSEFYVELIEAGIPEEDARYILPNAYTTNIVVKMDARELRHFFKYCVCNRAQWEIREMANLMLEKVKEVAPMLFKDVGASCVATGRCPEGKKSCGRVKE